MHMCLHVTMSIQTAKLKYFKSKPLHRYFPKLPTIVNVEKDDLMQRKHKSEAETSLK